MNDINLEQQFLIICALLSDPELFARCSNILDGKYFHKQYQKPVKFLLEYTEEYKILPTPRQMQAETGQLFENNMESGHDQYFLNLIEKFIKSQALTQAILASAELLEKDEGDGIETLIKNALLIGLNNSLGTEYFENPRERLLKLKDGNGKLSTGWKTLDEKLYGVNRQEILIFCAPSGGGKSVALQNISLNSALQGLNCVYFTLELSESLCSMRLDCMLTGIKSTEIFKNLDDVELKVKSTAKRTGIITIKKLPSGASTRDLRSYLKEYQIQKGFKPDVIVIDYLDLMSANAKVSAENMFVKDKFITEELRDLGCDLNALVVSASQMNRSAISESQFDNSMIAGGLSKINTADNVIGIFNSARARERGEIEFQLLKTRNSGGLDEKIVMSYDIECLRITDAVGGNEKVDRNSNIMNRINRKKEIQPIKSTDANIIDQETGEITETVSGTVSQPMKKAQHLQDLINRVKG